MITTADVTILSLLLLLSTASAQPPAPPPPYANPSVATIIVIAFAGVFFVGFFSLYLRLCSGSSSAPLNPVLAAASLRRRNPGLDANTVASFPVFHYSEVKELKIGKNALECAICLNEFEDDETLRLIPNCDHVFHPECIDAWLASHVTCPVCRANLVPVPEKPEVPPTGENISVRVVPQEVDHEPESEPESVYVHAPDQSRCAEAQDQSLGRRTRLFGKFSSSLQRGDPAQASLGRRTGFFGKFPRSHSTGHSLVGVLPGENTERFTLRFPDHLRKEVMTRALIRTATFNITEGSSRRSRRGGEGGSSRGARSYKRLDRAVKSDRWVITVPFFTSGKLTSGDGEGSTGRGKVTAVKLPSFKCLEPTTSGDVDDAGSGRPTV